MLTIVACTDSCSCSPADRRILVCQGVSMGGFGAAKFAVQYPDLFAFGMIDDGAMLNWSQVRPRRTRTPTIQEIPTPQRPVSRQTTHSSMAMLTP